MEVKRPAKKSRNSVKVRGPYCQKKKLRKKKVREHFVRRWRERIGHPVPDPVEVARDIRLGNNAHSLWDEWGRGRSHWHYVFNGKEVRVIYDEGARSVVTVMPYDSSTWFNERAKLGS